MSEEHIVWRRLDAPGHEAARLRDDERGWALEGTAVFVEAGQPCCLRYAIRCDGAWQTRAARVDGWIGAREVALAIVVDDEQRWWLDDREVAALAGCVDIDLNFSPVTNLLPIRRLALAIDAEQPITAAWLRFPALELEPLPQIYRRLGEARYRYMNADGSFTAELEVRPSGLVSSYPELWQAEALT